MTGKFLNEKKANYRREEKRVGGEASQLKKSNGLVSHVNIRVVHLGMSEVL